MTYSPPTQKLDVKQVGINYHLALGTSSTVGAANDRIYGYCLVPDNGRLGMLRQQTDLLAKNKLISYSSELLIDRDFVNWPRVTDGDFSGGALQQVFLNSSRFYDSDLDVRVPGQVFLHPAWQRTGNLATSLGAVTPQAVAWNDSVYVTFGGTSIYKQDGTTTGSSAITNKFLVTDGVALNVADGVNNVKYSFDGASWTLYTAASGAILQMWMSQQGTSGRFLYYTPDGNSLYKQDSSSATWGPALVPTTGGPFRIVDLCPYLSGIALLTQSTKGQGDFDVWYHDGANMSRMIRVGGYQPMGICNALGQLYITVVDSAGQGIPALIRIGAGSFDIVAHSSVPLAGASVTTATLGQPVSCHHYVYFPVSSPQVNGISTAAYIGVYDTLTGAYWHFPNMDATDAPGTGLRGLVVNGRVPVFPMVLAGNGTLQYGVNTSKLAVSGSPAPKYKTTGWLVSSRIDFNTPGISKQFRRVVVHHAALGTGESIVVKGYVDLEPVNFTTGLATSASITNSTVGTTTTVLTFPQATQGHSMYFAIQLNGGGTNSNQTTPILYYASVEISTPWGFEFTVDCTGKRQMLSGGSDAQNLLGMDLWYLLKNAWELGQTITYYDADTSSYVCTVERLERTNASPQYRSTPLATRDIESWVTVVLRVTNEN